MPYKSRAQERWAHTPTGIKALGGSAKVAEWDAETKGRKLPKRVSRPRDGKPVKKTRRFGSLG